MATLPSVVFVTAELAPFATSGGLGDVSAALPPALAALGHPVSVVLPLHRSVRERGLWMEHVGEVPVYGFDPHPRYRVFRARFGPEGAVPLYLVEHDRFFDRPALYGEWGGEYGDNLERFSFFPLAALEVVLAFDLGADVVHANDWHTALVPAHLRTTHWQNPKLTRSSSVFTIHNLAYQGRFAGDRFPVTRLPAEVFHPGAFEFYTGLNLMKGGIVFADAVTTVSPRYAAEITAPELGEFLDGVLRARGNRFRGILNGIDVERWNPATDGFLPARYDAGDLSGKRRCREALLAEMGLSLPEEVPLVGMVTRLTSQKGCDIVLGVASEMLRLGAPPGHGCALVLLGSGDLGLEQGFRELAARRPDRIAVRIGYDEALSHRIEAGADLFLMPSRYEPCGLNQMYSLRYGTVPVVRATGGLDDTVRDLTVHPENGNGFKFLHPSGDDLLGTMARALSAHRNPGEWLRIVRRGMAEDHSWRRSAEQYSALYRELRS